MRASTAAIVGAVALHGCAHTKERTMDTSSDRSAIVATIHEIGRGADERRWDAVRAAFAPRVVLGYGAPELLTPEEIVDRWRPLLSAFDRTQHVMRDERVDLVEPARARVQALFQATHHLRGAPGGELWTLDGRYEYELVRDASGAWKVSRMRMIPGASTGNGRLIELARERAGLPAPPPATVQVQRVSFDVEGQRVVGNLYLPAKPAGRLPAVAVFGT